MFIDEIKVFASAGHGGAGCVAFHREAYRPKGGPSGGNGGRGGSVILQADHDLNNLIQQYYVPRLIAEKGHAGMGKGMDGPAGKDLIIKVPCGTLVWRLTPKVIPGLTPGPEAAEVDEAAEEGEEEESRESPIMPISTGKRPVIRRSGSEMAYEINLEDEDDAEGASSSTRDPRKGELVVDLTTHGQQFVLCQGGRGGLGNRNFATARRQAPRFAQPGEPGDEGEFLLELRLIAEVGLVGYPNAGKSTLLKLLAGVIEPQAGTRELGHKVKFGYFAQHRVEMLQAGRTVLEEALDTPQRVTEEFIRTVLGCFLFRGDDVFKPVRVLSGGRKAALRS